MSAELKTGGPAFPDGSTNPWGVPEKAGMTLRDYFAAKVLANAAEYNSSYEAARIAYAYADAMLEVRE